jgi:hypothetical protein
VGIKLDANKAGQVMKVGPRQIYRLDSVGTIQRTGAKKIEVHIRGIWDVAHVNSFPVGNDKNDQFGTWLYWRQD